MRPGIGQTAAMPRFPRLLGLLLTLSAGLQGGLAGCTSRHQGCQNGADCGEGQVCKDFSAGGSVCLPSKVPRCAFKGCRRRHQGCQDGAECGEGQGCQDLQDGGSVCVDNVPKAWIRVNQGPEVWFYPGKSYLFHAIVYCRAPSNIFRTHIYYTYHIFTKDNPSGSFYETGSRTSYSINVPYRNDSYYDGAYLRCKACNHRRVPEAGERGPNCTDWSERSDKLRVISAELPKATIEVSQGPGIWTPSVRAYLSCRAPEPMARSHRIFQYTVLTPESPISHGGVYTISKNNRTIVPWHKAAYYNTAKFRCKACKTLLDVEENRNCTDWSEYGRPLRWAPANFEAKD